MRFQSDGLESPLWPSLIRIKRTLGLGSKQMASLLLLTQREYQAAELRRRELSPRSVLHLCHFLNISFEALMTNNVCYRTMARHFYGDKSWVPEKYTVAGKSKRRILANLLDYFESLTDWQRRLELMQYLQVNEAALDDPDGTINLRCTIEAVEWIHRQFCSDELLEQIGREMMLTPSYPLISNELKDARSIYELFDRIFSESGVLYRYLEKNFLWKIEKVFPGEKIVVSGRVNEEIREQIGKSHIQSRAGFVVRQGIFSAMPAFLGLDSAPAKVVDLFSLQEDTCLMELEISAVLRMNRRNALHLVR